MPPESYAPSGAMSLWTWPFSLTAPEVSYPPRLWPRVGGVHSSPRCLSCPSCRQQVMRPPVLCQLQLLAAALRARRGAHSGERQHGAVRYSHATARDARRSAHTGELQHGAMRYSAPATHRPQHGTHGAVRTPGSYSTAQCATDSSNVQCTRKTRALDYRAQQGAEQLGHD